MHAVFVIMLAGGVVTLHATPLASADAMLERVIAQLPTTRIQASGTIFVRQRRGVPLETYAFTLDADWRPPHTKVTYTFKDKHGTPLEALTFQPDAETVFTFRSGPDLVPGPLPDLTANISRTDVSWLDLSLYFLWWRGARFVGEDTVRGFHCQVIEVAAPAQSTHNSYAKVRLWISTEQGLLLQAQGFDATGRSIRRFWVQSVRQIDEQWMIQTLEVQQTNRDQRTRLQVVDVETEASTAP